MKFTPRLKAPSTTDKNWLKHGKGGYNYCIEIKSGSVLPNCVGYAWGRWRELLGAYHKLSRGNAENWYAKLDGYKRGKEPKLGAVVCWRKGKVKNATDGCGHVAVVEAIAADGTITCSESNYGASRFNVRKVKPPYNIGSLKFQGFIYFPFELVEEVKEEVAVDENDIVYTVKKGDTLIGIATKYKTTYKKLAEYNNIANPSRIDVGQKIRIPSTKTTVTTTPAKPTTPVEPTPTPTTPTTETVDTIYTVKKGDTLIGIATKYKTTYKKLAEYNGIKNPSRIEVGQKIKIPTTKTVTTVATPVVKETVYTVKRGDTLIGIATKYKTTYKKLAEYNGIKNPSRISVGQKIRIPKK